MPKITDNITAAIRYNFDAPINQSKEEDDKYLQLSPKMTRETKRKANNTQPYQEAIKTINLSTRCNTVAELTVLKMLVCVLRFLFAQCRGKQESPPTFILFNRNGKKYRKKILFRDVSEYGR